MKKVFLYLSYINPELGLTCQILKIICFKQEIWPVKKGLFQNAEQRIIQQITIKYDILVYDKVCYLTSILRFIAQ